MERLALYFIAFILVVVVNFFVTKIKIVWPLLACFLVGLFSLFLGIAAALATAGGGQQSGSLFAYMVVFSIPLVFLWLIWTVYFRSINSKATGLPISISYALVYGLYAALAATVVIAVGVFSILSFGG